MSLSYSQKQRFYAQFGQLLGAGISAGVALDKLSLTAHGNFRHFLRSMKSHLDAGATLGEAFGRAQPSLSEMEQVTLAGLTRSGQMEHGLQQLSTYFETLAVTRRRILGKLTYPAFLLHLTIVLLNAPILVTDGVTLYLQKVGYALALLYVSSATLIFGIKLLLDAASFLPSCDQVLRWVPLVGKVRRAFSLSRFCGTYNLQLEAGINVMDSLRAASKASRSGMIQSLIRRIIPELRSGAQVGPLLATSTSALPSELLSAFIVAEQAGRLDRTLDDLSRTYQEEGYRRLETATEWIPRLLYLSVAMYVGWRVVAAYSEYLKQIDEVLGSQ